MLALVSSSRLSLLKAATSSSIAARCRSLSSSSCSALGLSATHTNNNKNNNAVDHKIHHHHHHHHPSPSRLVVPVCAITKCTFTSNTVAAAAAAQQQQQQNTMMRRIPPNLTIDADSSFAPQVEFKKKKLPPISISSKEETEKEKEKKEKKKNKEDSDSDNDDKEEYNDYNDNDEDEEDLFYLPPPNVEYAIPLPERLHVPIHTLFAPQYDSHVGTIHLNDAVFGRNPIRVDLIKQAVVYFRNKKRGMRKAVTKTIAQVSGSGKKLRPQKGQGMARVGHSRPPHFRGGAKAHGPKNVTNYGKIKLNKKVRRLALCHALSQKLLEGNLILWNQLHDGLTSHKTSDLAQLLEPWQIGGRHGSSALILDHYHHHGDDETNDNDENDSDDAKTINTKSTTSKSTTSYNGVPTNLWVAATNLNRVKVGSDHVASVYDILKHEKLVLTLAALQQLQSRLKNV